MVLLPAETDELWRPLEPADIPGQVRLTVTATSRGYVSVAFAGVEDAPRARRGAAADGGGGKPVAGQEDLQRHERGRLRYSRRFSLQEVSPWEHMYTKVPILLGRGDFDKFDINSAVDRPFPPPAAPKK